MPDDGYRVVTDALPVQFKEAKLPWIFDSRPCGLLAQLVERTPDKGEVAGSNPA